MAGFLPAVVLLLVVLSLLLRERLKIALAPWQLMLAGAAFVLLFGQISPSEALGSIDWGVMLFLYGMFILAVFLHESWYLEHLGYKVMKHFSSPFAALLFLVLAAGFGSAILLNDTLAIIGVPLCLLIAARSNIAPAPLLVGLAVAVTIGGMMSPIGNPQNYIVASQPEIGDPFFQFAFYLAVPTVLSLFALTVILWKFYPQLRRMRGIETDVRIKSNDYSAARTGFQIVIALCALRAVAGYIPVFPAFELWWIALAGAAVAIVMSGKWKTALRADWETLAFFAGMFVLTESGWLSGFFQQFMPDANTLADPWVALISGLVISQVLSNVPFVILYLKALGNSASVLTLILLAAGSTLAGSLTVLGAASNVIILQSAEKKGWKFPVWDFMLIGFASTIVSVALIWAWISALSLI